MRGMPYAGLEDMASRCPTVVSANPARQEILDEISAIF
jgi:hypothetical protein